MASFNIGDKVIYPNQGIAEIKDIKEGNLKGTSTKYYILKTLGKNMEVMVPVKNAEKIGIRFLITPDKVNKVYDILKEKGNNPPVQWHHRYNNNIKRLQSGSIFETAQVVRELASIQRKKSLAVKESRMMDNAMKLLISEIATVNNVDEQKIEQVVRSLLALESTQKVNA